jgi:hypothetical protein
LRPSTGRENRRADCLAQRIPKAVGAGCRADPFSPRTRLPATRPSTYISLSYGRTRRLHCSSTNMACGTPRGGSRPGDWPLSDVVFASTRSTSLRLLGCMHRLQELHYISATQFEPVGGPGAVSWPAAEKQRRGRWPQTAQTAPPSSPSVQHGIKDAIFCVHVIRITRVQSGLQIIRVQGRRNSQARGIHCMPTWQHGMMGPAWDRPSATLQCSGGTIRGAHHGKGWLSANLPVSSRPPMKHLRQLVGRTPGSGDGIKTGLVKLR